MFERVASHDVGIIVRGIFILLVIVIIGVGLAEHQLATLTQRQEEERFFYIGSNREDGYSAYVFGYGLPLGIVDSIAHIVRTDTSIIVQIANHYITIPTTRETLNRSRVWYWFDVWYRQFVTEAFTAKQQVLEYWTCIKSYIEPIFKTLKVEAQAMVTQVKQYIREYR